MMPKDNVIAVVGKRRAGNDVGHCPVGGGEHRVHRFAAFVALHAADIEALVQLMAVRTHTAERAACPWLADCSHKKTFLTAGFEQRPIGRRQMKRLRASTYREAQECEKRMKPQTKPAGRRPRGR